MKYKPATHIVHYDHEEKIATNILYDRDNGRSFREVVKIDEQGIVKQYKFKWLGIAKRD